MFAKLSFCPQCREGLADAQGCYPCVTHAQLQHCSSLQFPASGVRTPRLYQYSMLVQHALSANTAPTANMVGLDWLQLENRAALYNFASIATAADGLILSRGNLGLDVAPEKMALVQKSVVSRCNLLGKPVIITRVVDTMATAPRPTRSLLLSSI